MAIVIEQRPVLNCNWVALYVDDGHALPVLCVIVPYSIEPRDVITKLMAGGSGISLSATCSNVPFPSLRTRILLVLISMAGAGSSGVHPVEVPTSWGPASGSPT